MKKKKKKKPSKYQINYTDITDKYTEILFLQFDFIATRQDGQMH